MSEPNPRKVLIETLEYVKKLVELQKNVVWRVSEYKEFSVTESDLQGLPGIRYFYDGDDGTPVWMEVERLHKTQSPDLPELLVDWMKPSHDPDRVPILYESRMVTVSNVKAKEWIATEKARRENVMDSPKHPGMSDVRLLSEDDSRLFPVLEEYLERQWYPWSVLERPRRESIRLYGRLFGVQQKVSEGESEGPLEVIWGVGQAVWNAEDESGTAHTINHPLIEFQVEFELDGSQSLLVRPRSALQAKPRLNLEAFEALENKGTTGVKRFFDESVAKLESEERMLSADDASSYDLILRSAVAQLSEKARFWPDVTQDATDRSLPKAGEELAITDTWALYARKKTPNALAEDIERLQKNAETIESTEKKAAFNFASLPSDAKPSSSGGGWSSGSSGSWEGAGRSEPEEKRELYFPKPFNDAQRAIVRRLEKEDGVVVQGPPGTGKTHTIANIICHYLALGRRVLVTAKSETALKVLKDQIPKQIQPLVVSLVSSDREGMRQQKEAIETLQGKVLSLQGRERSLYQDIRRGEEDIVGLEAELDRVAKDVEALVKSQLEEVKLPFLEQRFKNATDLAKWVVEGRERFAWLEDKLGIETRYDPKFSGSDLEDLQVAKNTVGDDLSLLGVEIPQVDQLPTTKNIARAHRDLVARDELESAARKGTLLDGVGPEQVETLDSLWTEVSELASWIAKTEQEEPWRRELFDSYLGSGKRPVWYELARELDRDIDRVAAERMEFVRRPIDFGTERPEEIALIREAAERAAEGKPQLTLIQRMKRSNREMIERVRIVGQVPNSATMWKHVVAYFIFQDSCRSLAIRWNAVAKEGPLPEIAEDSLLTVLEEQLSVFRSLEDYARKAADLKGAIEREFKRSDIRVKFEPQVEALEEIAKLIELNVARYRLTQSEATRDSAIEYLSRFELEEARAALRLVQKELGSGEASEEDVVERWRLFGLRLKALHELQPSFDKIESVCGLVSESGAPKWAEKLQTQRREEEEQEIANAFDAWSWARAKSVFERDDAQAKLSRLEAKRIEVEKRMRSTLELIVEKKTYLELCGSMSARAKSLLSQFMAAISNVGTGAGKKAPFYRAAAQRAMHGCAGSIPCWIMPSWRASEVLPSEYGSFDLVVVDEASQCDIRELPALARGKKVLVVGDDKQVSPTVISRALTHNRVLQLRHNYLREQPFADLMLPDSSLYDLASSVFAGGQILLNEHFRCVEPIIRFSFQFYRKDGILPVRVPKAKERLDPPLVGVYVKNGCRIGDRNEAEAEAIVDEIEKLVNDPAYAGRTIGVISMVKRDQAKRIGEMLLERIGQKKFLDHEIVCGDSATFQGREKDIVFLSMVDAPGRRAIRKVTARMYEQRYNVAASRARDRMYVYYSFDPRFLQSDDLKSRLLSHLREPMPAVAEVDKELIELCESPFERDVFSRLVELGYSVTPQVPCAGRRIDLVVEGESDSRLAVELDGDTYHGPEVWLEDWSRQKILERVGWKFWRCWYSSFVAAPDECIASLVSRLEEEGIKPTQGKSVSRCYSEFRTVSDSDERSEQTVEPDSIDLDEVVEVGDTVLVSRGDPKGGYVTLSIVEENGNLSNHVYEASHPVSQALLGLVVEDEVDVDIGKGEERVCIVRLEKREREGSGASQDEAVETSVAGPTTMLAQDDSEAEVSPEVENHEDSMDGPRPAATVDDILGRGSQRTNLRTEDRRDESRAKSDSFDKKREPRQETLGEGEFELEGLSSVYGKTSSPKESDSSVFPDPSSAKESDLAACLKAVVGEMGPMIVRHALAEYIKRSPVSKLGRLIECRLAEAMQSMIRNGDLVSVPGTEGSAFIYSVVRSRSQDDVYVRPGVDRDLDDIPRNELAVVYKQVASSQPGLDSEARMRAVLEFYGKKKLTARARQILGVVMRKAEEG